MSIDPRLPDFVGPGGAPVNKTADLRRQMNRLLGNAISKGAITIGTATITWGGATKDSNATTITHGLNKVPAVVIVVCAQMSDGNGFAAHGAYSAVSGTPTTVDIYASTPSYIPVAAVTCPVSWIVFG